MDDFISKQDRDSLKKEQMILKELLKSLNFARKQTLTALKGVPAEYEQEMLQSTLHNIDNIILSINGQLKLDTDKVLKEASKRGVKDQTSLYNNYFVTTGAKAVADSLFGPVEISVFKTVEESANDFLRRFSASLRERVKNTIQAGLAHGRNEGEVSAQLVKQFDVSVAQAQRAVHHIYQTAYNKANHEVLIELEKGNPQLQKQWYSMMDRKTTQPCLKLHGQIKPITEPFVEPESGSQFMYPPAVFGNPEMMPAFHFCRSRAIPYVG